MKEFTCRACGKTFSASGSRQRRFCSRQCGRYAAKGFKHNRPAELTAKMVAGRMISPKLGHKVEMLCDGCGQTFTEYPSKRPRPLKFCTRQCGLDYQRGRCAGQENYDLDPVNAHPKPAEPGMNVIYDPIKKELRNE